jgi:holliday junction DNA helicase RuvB
LSEKTRVVSKEQMVDEIDQLSLRPDKLKEFIGQKKVRENLKTFIDAARMRSEALDHVIFHGPPGLGKTTLAQIVAKEMGVNFRTTSGPTLTKAGDLAAILTNLQPNDVLFIDEIHRLQTAVEEMLYTAMEDFELDIIIGEGPAARNVRIPLPRFTLVGATTRLGLISGPLRDRFGIPMRLEFYEPEELMQVVIRAAGLLQTEISNDGAYEIARRSRGTPRIALRLLKRVRDIASVANENSINKKIADTALIRLEVDDAGLDSADRRYLLFMAENYSGGPVGIETISAGLSEQRDVLEETIEPFLLQQGFLQRTPRGRVLGLKAYEKIGIQPPLNLQAQPDLLEEV